MATPNLNVEFDAVSDVKGKFARLAKLLGLADADHARGKCEHLWMACTTRGEIDLPRWLVEQHLGEQGPDALVMAELARWAGGRGDSDTRRLRISGARKHCTWMTSNQEQSSKAGKSNARTANRVGGKFAPKTTIEMAIGNHPSDPHSDPPIPEDQKLSPARTIPWDGGEPGTRHPRPHATQQGAATPGQSASSAAGNVAEPHIDPTPDRVESPPSPGTSAPRSEWHDRKRWWAAMLAADARIRAAGIEPNAGPLPNQCAGENEKLVQRCVRHFTESGYGPEEVDAKMLHVVAVAEAEAMREGHRRWFKPAMIWDPERANRAADTSLEEARRRRATSKAAGSQPAIAPPRRKEPLHAPTSSLTPEERIALAAESRAQLYGQPTARAGPASAPPREPTDDESTDESTA